MTVSGRREDDTGVTLGEVYRLVKDLKSEHGDKLDAIDAQVRITNGRTTKLEAEVVGLNREMRDLKQATIPPTPPSLPIMTPEGESLSIRVSPKMWALIAAAFGSMTIFAPMVAEWVKQMVGGK